MSVKVIRITGGKKPKVKPYTVRLHKTTNDQVKWRSNGKFVVCFEKTTPFKEWNFYPGNTRSGLAQVKPNPRKKYKYSVGIGGRWIDPNVIIDR